MAINIADGFGKHVKTLIAGNTITPYTGKGLLRAYREGRHDLLKHVLHRKLMPTLSEMWKYGDVQTAYWADVVDNALNDCCAEEAAAIQAIADTDVESTGYDVEVSVTLRKTVRVDAATYLQAKEAVHRMLDTGEIGLDPIADRHSAEVAVKAQ